MFPETKVGSQPKGSKNTILWMVVVVALVVSVGAAFVATKAKSEVASKTSLESANQSNDELQIVSLGDGLRLENGVLKNSGVISLGGQTGSVQLEQTPNPQTDAAGNASNNTTTVIRATQTVIKEPAVTNNYTSTTVVEQPQPAATDPTFNSATIKTGINSASAFAVQRASGANLLTADTLSNQLTIAGQTNITGGTGSTPSNVSTANLVAQYSFEQGSGTTATDTTVNANHASKPVGQSPDVGFPAWSTDAKVGDYSLRLDGTQGIDIPKSTENTFGSSAMTMEAWVKFSGSRNNVYYNAIAAQRAENGNRANARFGFFWGRTDLTSGNRMLFQASENGVSVPITLTGNATLLNEKWYHVAVVYDGSSLRQYINGQLDAITPITYNMFDSPEPINIGYTHDHSNTTPITFFNGSIDELKFYKRALSGSELLEEYGQASAANALSVTGGNVGIGTNNPLHALHVQGNDITASLQANPVVTDNEFQNSPVLQIGATYDADTSSAVRSAAYNSTIQTVVTSGGASPTGRMAFSSGTGLNILNILSTGNVGIGTVTPQQKLTVANGNIAIETTRFNMNQATPTAGGSLAANVYYYKLVSVDNAGGTSSASNEIACSIDGSTYASCLVGIASVPANVTSIRIYRGTSADGQTQYITQSATPGSPFTYLDTGTGTWTAGTPPTVSTSYAVKISGNGSTNFTGGNVGIGTNSPGSLLTVMGSQPISATGSGTAAIQAFNVTGGKGGNTTGTTGQTAGVGGSIVLASGAGGDAATGSANGNGGAITIQGGAGGAGTGTAGVRGQISMQASGGNVGIGLTASATGARLQVSTGGTANVGVVVTGFAGQTADLIQAKNSSGTNLLTLSSTGVLTVVNATVTNLTVTHIAGAGSTPAIAAGTGACTTPTISITGTDTAGTITVTTGTGCAAAGKLATVTFASAYATAPRVTLTPATQSAATMPTFVNSSTITSSLFEINNTAAATSSTTYRWYYMVIQ